MTKPTNSPGGCSCTVIGCLPLIFLILTLTALWFGLPTPWGTFNLDLLPPQIRQTGPST